MQEKVLFLIGSARPDGNAEQLARQAAREAANAEQRWLALRDHPLAPFEDRRHQALPVYAHPSGHELTLYDATLWADHLVFVAPLYWYSMPADLKRYLDHWSGWQRLPGEDFRARMARKQLSVVTSVSDADLGVAQPMVESFKLTAAHLKMTMGRVLIGRGNRPGDVMNDELALNAAKFFLRREPAAGAGASPV